ncbi:MAG: AMP-binding protein [Acidobacteriota bacterium]|nr:AMP-binding protein [Acidobacteriota bacterium]
MHLLQRLAQYRQRTAVVCAEGSFSYGQLEDAAGQLAAAVRSRLGEAAAGSRVAFRVPPGFGYAATLLGIWRAGAIGLPLALSYPRGELAYALGDADVALVLDHSGGSPNLREVSTEQQRPWVLWDKLLAEAGEPAGDLLPSEDDAALILYTSGSTGRPKGVVHTHSSLAAQMTSLVEAWRWSPADRILGVLPLHHVHGLINVMGCALWSGACWQPLPAFDAAATWRHLAHSPLTLFMAVPTIYRRLVAHWEEQDEAIRRELSDGAARLRLMVSGSAALPVPLLERWRQITGHTLLERYGMTEIGMALSNPLEGCRRAGTVGRPLPGVEAQVVDDAGQPLNQGRPGELWVRGPGVFREYWRRPEATDDAFRDGWFRTGDEVVLEDGAYRILGRRNVDIVKTGGYKVSALEVEAVLREHPAVAECAVVGLPDEEWGERLSAAVVLRSDRESLSLEELRDWARPRLAPYKLPRSLTLLPELPRNALGKVVKPRLTETLAES